MKKIPTLILLLFAFMVSAQEPCGEVVFGAEVDPGVYPPSFIEDIMNITSPCVNSNTPSYELNAITLDTANLIPCAGDTISGLWVEAPNHEPLCVYTYPENAAFVLGPEFIGDIVVGEESFFIAIVGIPLGGGGNFDNYVSTGFIPVNPTYNDTLEVITCDPDSSGLIITQSFQSACGCDSTMTYVFEYEEIFIDISGPNLICYGDSIDLTANPSVSDNFQYSWSTGDTTKSIPVFLEGLYHVTVTSSAGCEYTGSHSIGFHPPSYLTIEAPEAICVGEFIQLTENSSFNSYLWTLPNGSTLSGDAVSFPAVGSLTGIYYLDAIDPNGCRLNDSTAITVDFPVELPEFPDIEACKDDTLAIYLEQALEDTHTFYEWVNGKGHSYELNHLWIIKRNWRGTNYIVATTGEGCITEKSFELYVNRCKTNCDSVTMYFPNTFSPNFDGTNDRYIIGGICDEYLIRKFQIYDRWGGLLFEQKDFCPNDPASSWDGTAGGKVVESGVYVYLAHILDTVTGKECIRKGAITVRVEK